MACEYLASARTSDDDAMPVVKVAYDDRYASLNLAPLFPCMTNQTANAWITRVSRDLKQQLVRFFAAYPTRNHLSRRAMLDFSAALVRVTKERCYARVRIRRNTIVGILGGHLIDGPTYFSEHARPGGCCCRDPEACEDRMWLHTFNSDSLLLLPRDDRPRAKTMHSIALLPAHDGNQMQFVQGAPEDEHNVRALPIFHYNTPFFFYVAADDIMPGEELLVEHGVARKRQEKKEEEEEEAMSIDEAVAAIPVVPARPPLIIRWFTDAPISAASLIHQERDDTPRGFDTFFAEMARAEEEKAGGDGFGISPRRSPSPALMHDTAYHADCMDTD